MQPIASSMLVAIFTSESAMSFSMLSAVMRSMVLSPETINALVTAATAAVCPAVVYVAVKSAEWSRPSGVDRPVRVSTTCVSASRLNSGTGIVYIVAFASSGSASDVICDMGTTTVLASPPSVYANCTPANVALPSPVSFAQSSMLFTLSMEAPLAGVKSTVVAYSTALYV